MGNVNRKSTRDEIAHLKALVSAAFPDCDVILGSHGDYGGHRAPRDHTLSFRVRGPDGRFRSNVVWVHPDDVAGLTVDAVTALVKRSNGT